MIYLYEIADSNHFTTREFEGIKLTNSYHVEWIDIIGDYLQSQDWGKSVKQDTPMDAYDKQRVEVVNIAAILKIVVGN